MKRFLSIILTSFVALCAVAQDKVSFSVEQTAVRDSIFTIRFTGKIAPGWHVYSVDNDEIFTSATFTAEEISGCQLVDGLKPIGDVVRKYDDIFKCEVSYFENKCTFEQKIKVVDNQYDIKGYLTYNACNNDMCLPPTNVECKFVGIYNPDNKKVNKTPATPKVADEPKPQEVEAVKDSAETSVNESINNIISINNYNNNVLTPEANGEENSLLWIFLSCFLGGFLALLTPCVWPMIPLTVSYFIKRTTSRRRAIRDAVVYALSIIIIYVALGLIITIVSGRPDALNAMSTNAVFNIFFTLLLVVFGLSLLGAFELTLPASWSSAIDRKSEAVGGILGIFLMAFMLALVSFSCTGPIIGLLLVELSTIGSIAAPALGMLGFSVALALPLALFAMFPTLLNKIPRSGSWMMTVKTTLGFIELLFAFKFFSVADVAYGWGLLPRETFLSLWIAIAVAYALCMWNVIKLPHDEGAQVGVGRLMAGIVSLAFAIYLVPGLWGAPLNAVSAFAPPIDTQDFVINGYIDASQSSANQRQIKFTDLDEAKKKAIDENKMLLIDFTGYGCVNCRKMEQTVLSDSEVKRLIDSDFVYVTLYVDDKRKLAETEVAEENGKEIRLRTIGDKWSLLQRQLTGVNAQPFFVIMSPATEKVVATSAFTDDVSAFLAFLNINN